MSDDDSFRLSRRKALTALGTVGVASAGAGLGTSAYFNDTESFNDNMVQAGQLDLAVKASVYEYQGQAGERTRGPAVQNGAPSFSQNISDVKPGDYSYGKFCFSLVDNPGYIWVNGQLTANDENSVTEPEADADGESNAFDPDGDIDGDGELADAIDAYVFYGPKSDGLDQGQPSQQSFSTIASGSLSSVLSKLNGGMALDADGSTGGTQAFTGTSKQSFDDDRCLYFAWEVPTSVENEIQTDSVEFDLQFTAVQERHNSGTNNPFSDS